MLAAVVEDEKDFRLRLRNTSVNWSCGEWCMNLGHWTWREEVADRARAPLMMDPRGKMVGACLAASSEETGRDKRQKERVSTIFEAV